MAEEMQYSIRESSRARHVNLRISVQRGLEIVVPRGFDRARIPRILEGRREWIRKSLAEISRQARSGGGAARDALPERIEMPALGESWRVEYEPSPSARAVLRQAGPDTLRLSGAVASKDVCRALLLRWLRARAGKEFGAMLAGLARETGLSFGRLSIRCQSSRWGSCSMRCDISLNLKMLFLTPPQVRQILIHELCHTRHHNHSRAFWGLVSSLDSGDSAIRAEIRASWRTIPAWI